VLPKPVRHAVRHRIDAAREFRYLPERLERLETMMLESHEQLHGRSRQRWSKAEPDADLTMGREMTGDAFIAKAEAHDAFGAGKTVVEVGPGYGRLLDAALRRGVAFERWIGVDLSPRNVEHLQARFAGDSRIAFLTGDAETVDLDGQVDTVVSSLTFKHLYPSFEVALAHLTSRMRDGGSIVIDLIEGDRRYFEGDAKTYIRWYGRDEVGAIFERCGCEIAAFDEVEHDPDHRRLLAVGKRTA
jgi:SAM-dependent methyltransferase